MRVVRARPDAELAPRVKAAAGRVVDRELGYPLAELDLVGEVMIRPSGSARITVGIVSAAISGQDRLRADVQQAALGVDGITDVVVELEPLDDAGRMQVARTLQSKPGLGSLGTKTRVYAVASGKGGVGKSVVTANLAASLAVTVVLDRDPDRHDGVVVHVDDEGDGIPEESWPLVFGRFWHGPDNASTGLGLYVARGLVEAHGGDIEVGRAEGGGARFTVRLRSALPHGATASDASGAVTAAGRPDPDGTAPLD